MILYHIKNNGLIISVKGTNHKTLMETLRVCTGHPKDEPFSIGSRMSGDELKRIANGKDNEEYELGIKSKTTTTIIRANRWQRFIGKIFNPDFIYQTYKTWCNESDFIVDPILGNTN